MSDTDLHPDLNLFELCEDFLTARERLEAGNLGFESAADIQADADTLLAAITHEPARSATALALKMQVLAWQLVSEPAVAAELAQSVQADMAAFIEAAR